MPGCSSTSRWAASAGRRRTSTSAREILKTRASLDELLAQHTGQPLARVKNDTERDYFMSAAEAKAYGLVDEVIINQQSLQGGPLASLG